MTKEEIKELVFQYLGRYPQSITPFFTEIGNASTFAADKNSFGKPETDIQNEFYFGKFLITIKNEVSANYTGAEYFQIYLGNTLISQMGDTVLTGYLAYDVIIEKIEDVFCTGAKLTGETNEAISAFFVGYRINA